MDWHSRISRSFASLTVGMALCVACPGHAAAQDPYAMVTRGTRILEHGTGLRIKVLVEAANLGGAEVDIGEITFPAGSAPTSGHVHAAIEIFYILSGQLDHIVNGESHLLDPGMVGIVRPGDEVIHRVASDHPVKALVIWAPGGEVERIARFFQQRPIDKD
ncbi:MAG TPA: cupin domain-containing protein [Gemmatimonadales bacterium]